MSSDDLGPLEDPSPAEQAMSLLRAAWDTSGMMIWPESPELSHALQVAETRATTSAHYDLRMHDPVDRVRGRRRNHIALACGWVSMAFVARQSHNLATETRLAGRAIELLSWMSDDGK